MTVAAGIWRRLALIAIVVGNTTLTRIDAEAIQPSITPATQLQEAERLVAARRLEEAERIFTAVLDEARNAGSEGDAALALIGRADVRLRLRRAAEGLPDAREAVELVERLNLHAAAGRARLVLGLIETATGNPAVARKLIEQAIEDYRAAGDRTGAARAGDRLSMLLGENAEEQLAVLERAVEDAAAGTDRQLEGEIRHAYGDYLFTSDRFEEAIASLQVARELFMATGNQVALGTVHNSMGRVYRAHGRLDEALREQQRALALHRKANDTGALMQSLNAVGVTYQRMRFDDETRRYLEEALALAVQSGNARAQDFLEANLAGVMAAAGDHAAAAKILERVIERGLDSFPAIRLTTLADAYIKLGRIEDAVKAADRSIAACGSSRDVCSRAYAVRSAAALAAGNAAEARHHSATALDVLEQLRGQLLPADRYRSEFQANLEWVYTRAIGLRLADGNPKAALEAAEQARARSFLDLLESRSLNNAANSSTQLPLTLRGGAPAGVPVTATAPATTAADLARVAAAMESTMVVYWVGDDESFAWVVTREGNVQARRLEVSRARLVRLVRQTQPFADRQRNAAAESAPPMSLAEGDAAWRELYALLMGPIRDLLPATPGALLTIVPHGVLNAVSFAALKSPRGRYLLEDYTIHYAPSGALFHFTAPRAPKESRQGSALLIADPLPPRRSALDEHLPRLPGSRTESSAIAALMRRGQASVLEDAKATEAAVRAQVGERTMLHFATHAVVFDDRPFESHLVLAPSGADSAADGFLTAEEVYAMRLRADLVVLSACRSAAGAAPGDAIATFARAFLYAGTSSLVASVWDVADDPANRLIPAFYRAWFRGAGKADALRRAQLQLLRDLRAGRVQVSTDLGPVPLPEHPVFWAGFVLFGEPR